MAASMRCWRLVERSLKYASGGSYKSLATLQLKVVQRCLSTSSRLRCPAVTQGTASGAKAEKVSKAMKAYLERAKTHDDFLKAATTEFEIGKRHLANIMGLDPDAITQEEVDKAIEYLLPSGLFDKKARPIMKPPVEIFPKRKAAEFGMDGRPFHFLFYTSMPNYYQLLHMTVAKLEELKRFEDAMIRRGIVEVDAQRKLQLTGSEWVSKKVIELQLQETLNDHHYTRLLKAMHVVAEHPYAYRAEEFVMKYRNKLQTESLKDSIPQLMTEENGRAYMESTGKRKRAIAMVRLLDKGTGKININGQDILYFKLLQDREQVLFPLQFVGKLGEMDVEAQVEGGGPSGQSGAIRLAIATALMSFVDTANLEKMRQAGLLTKDIRVRERKKPGQEGARRKFTWKKR